MAKTTMNILHKGIEYQAEDVYRSPHTFVQYEIVSFMKIEGAGLHRSQDQQPREAFHAPY